MLQLYDAGLSYDPVSGMPVFDPSACAPALLKALWRGFCGVADTINTKQLGRTDEALEELQLRLHEHAARLRSVVPRSRRLRRGPPGATTEPACASPAPSSSDEDAEQCANDNDEGRRPSKRARPVRTIADSEEDEEPESKELARVFPDDPLVQMLVARRQQAAEDAATRALVREEMAARMDTGSTHSGIESCGGSAAHSLMADGRSVDPRMGSSRQYGAARCFPGQ